MCEYVMPAGGHGSSVAAFPTVLAEVKFLRHFKLIWVVQFYRKK